MKQSEIKVFHPGSKKADFSILCVDINKGAKKLHDVLSPEAGQKALSGFRSLKRLGADNMTMRVGDRRIRIQLAA